MSDLDVQRLDARFKAWKAERCPDKDEGEAFEYYSVFQILKAYDLDDEELASGNLGGGDDGGADALYIFINGVLMTEESPVPALPKEMHLVIVQSKYSEGFKEFPITKLHAFSGHVFDFSKKPADIDAVKHLNSNAKDAIKVFRTKLDAIIKHAFTFKVSFYYVSKSQNPPNPKQQEMAEGVVRYVKTQYSSGQVEFSFWGCPELLAADDKILSGEGTLKVAEKFYTSKKHTVCLAKLNDFAEFLEGENGEMKARILEANIRDFQGIEKEVNADIRSTITSGDEAIDFWWLNNGVTILAQDCSLIGNSLRIVEPKIVNGLQTSHVVFDEYRNGKRPKDDRHVLIKVIVDTDELTSMNIIKATNNQTLVQKISLKAMERVHFDIENKLKLSGLFYDRRKGKYRQQNKPVSKIVSMTAMGQAIMSILLQRPDDARARPATALGKTDVYGKIFSESYDLNVYVMCMLLDRQVEDFLDGLVKSKTIKPDVRRNLKYYENMVVACELCKASRPSAKLLADNVGLVTVPIDQKILKAAHESVLASYQKLGETDKDAKGPYLKEIILKELAGKYPAPATP